MTTAEIVCILILAPAIVGLWILVCIGILYLVSAFRDIWKEF